jgi:Flp pilus assembly protein TadG
MIAALRRLWASRSGTAMVEFAFVLPVALVLYYGTLQLQDAIACNRKVTIATRALADLVAQNLTGDTNAAAVDGVLGATTQILAPYPSAPATMRVTQVLTDATSRTTVQWSRARGGLPLAKGTTVTIPAQMRIPGTYFLLAEVTYAYTPPVFFGDLAALRLGDSLYMLPRNSAKIDCGDC